MDWRATDQSFARIIDLESLPRGIKRKIDLEPGHVAISLGPSPLVWTNQILPLKKLRKDPSLSKMIIYDSKRHNLSIRQKHVISSVEEILSFEIAFSFEVDGDAGALKLAKTEMPVDTGDVGNESLSRFMKKHCSGHWKSILEGVTMENRRSPERSDRVTSRILERFNTIGARCGLTFSDCSIMWRATQREKSDHNRTSADRVIDELDSKFMRQGAEQLAGDETFADEMLHKNAELQQDILRSKVDQRRKDIENENEIGAIKRENRIKKAKHEGSSEIRKMAKEEAMEQGRKAMDQALRAGEVQINQLKTKIASLEYVVQHGLDPSVKHRILTSESLLINLNGAKVDLNQFMSNLRSRVKSGTHNAVEIDSYISELEKFVNNNPMIDQSALSDIYACIAEFHRHRGNKFGDMEKYLSKSLSLNEYNMTALRTKIDYLWAKSPQQFIPRKAPHFEEQLNGILSLITKIQIKDPYFTEPENFDLMEKYGIVSEALLNCG